MASLEAQPFYIFRKGKVMEEYWWIQSGVIEDEKRSGIVRASVANKMNYSQLKQAVWKWYRKHAGRSDLTIASKLVLWAICERYRMTYSSHDAYVYYGKMTGLTRKTVGRAVQELVDKEVIWIAKEGERTLLKKVKAGVRKHILLVGLGVMLADVGRK